MYEIGRMHWLQRGCEFDAAEAEKWWKMSAERGYAEAQYMLGQNYHYGTVAHRRHYETALSYYRMAAQQVLGGVSESGCFCAFFHRFCRCVCATQGHKLAEEGYQWIKKRLWRPDEELQLSRARARHAEAVATHEDAVRETKAQIARTEAALSREEALEQRLFDKLEKVRRRKLDLDTAQQLYERESERAVIAETELEAKRVRSVIRLSFMMCMRCFNALSMVDRAVMRCFMLAGTCDRLPTGRADAEPVKPGGSQQNHCVA